jgi:hypothetical protein
MQALPCETVRRVDADLMTIWQRSVDGDQHAGLKDPDLVDEAVHLEHASPRGVGHAVGVAANTDHALVRDAPFEPKRGALGQQRQWQQSHLLLGESLG